MLYNCSAARPNIESATNEEEIEVQTETLAITAAPLANGYVKARTGDSTTDTVYPAGIPLCICRRWLIRRRPGYSSPACRKWVRMRSEGRHYEYEEKYHD